MTKKILFLSGSSRKGSLNKKLARIAHSMAEKTGATATFIDLADFDMPIYNGDLEEASGLPENAKKLKKLFIEHDGFFIASPEYNSGYAPLLKNALDWISRKETPEEPALNAFNGKIAAISAASPSFRGGERGLVQLRMMLGNINVHVIPAQATISSAHEAFDEKGNFKDDKHTKMLQNVVEQFVKTTKALKA